MNKSSKTIKRRVIEWWAEQIRKGVAQKYRDIYYGGDTHLNNDQIEEIYLSEHPETEQPKPEVLEGNKGDLLEDKYVDKLEREIFRMQTQLTRTDIEVDKLKEENKSLREANERIKEALEDLIERTDRGRNILQSSETNKGYWGIFDTQKAKESLQANPNT